jgi:endonuclease G, mitochondrial
VRVDFKEEYLQTIPFEADIVEILYISELDDTQPDLAFVRLWSNGRPLPPPISLFDGKLREKQTVAVIGYPAEDSRNGAADQSRIFANIFDIKRLAPGEITGVGDSFVFTHDCTTLGGNSGSVVVDVETGAAVGLHFAGEYLLDNYAVRASTVRESLERLDRDVVFVSPPAPQPLEEFKAKLRDVQSRAGYDPHFLGDGEFAVPLPMLGPGLDELTVVVGENAAGTEKYLLKYTHFSIAIHRGRRIALFTVSNIDGEQSRKIKRKKDVWGFDPRISEEFQTGNQLYQGNDLDRGHLVRRLDPAWGTLTQAKRAELDTFFFTNCTPQHAGFNQKLWLELEDYLLNSADTRNFKACIFTGPIFTEEDRPYRGMLLPLAYWKVAVMIHDQRDALTATAYIVSQKDLLSRLEFVFGQFKMYQVSISEIEQRTNLDFGDLKRFDPLEQQEAAGSHELASPEDLRL